MQSPRTGRRKAQVTAKKCVACGCCVKICPRSAIEVYKGMVARIDPEKCIGCGKCAKECPAAAIRLREAVS
ncbi:NAD(P)H-quinone oxidoreductase subunit I, chloroplastic [bioreactor metagenome]|uniref:NAD(P)H-quinone oxidoreductase subunit I, chloroplastic n=1 Tax=bioreactor metagenome TaxID=1076179 RepID=A0A645BQ10_9ZZZZ